MQTVIEVCSKSVRSSPTNRDRIAIIWLQTVFVTALRICLMLSSMPRDTRLLFQKSVGVKSRLVTSNVSLAPSAMCMCVVTTFRRLGINRAGYVGQSILLVVSGTGKMPSRRRFWFRKTGSAASPLVLHTQTESGACSWVFQLRVAAFIQLCRQPPSGRFRVYRVTQLHTDGVHRRESAGTGPVVLRVW